MLATIEPGAIAAGSGPVILYADGTGFADEAFNSSGRFSQNEVLWLNTFNFCFSTADPNEQIAAIKSEVETVSAQRAQAGEEWGTLGYMVAEDWSGAQTIANRAFGTNANPILDSAFDFPVRYATVGVLAAEENGWSGRPASVLGDSWSYGAHDQTYPDHALPNLMLGNHDLVRLGDLLQRANIADPDEAEYWNRHRLMFMVQGAYSGPITRYYGEEIGDELPGYANQVTSGCASLGLCDDHVARTSAKILEVTVTSSDLSVDQLALMQFHQDLMDMRSQYPALSHGTRQHLYSDNDLYIDLKTHGDEQIVFAMNVSDSPIIVELNASLFASAPPSAWDLLNEVSVDFVSGYLTFALQPLSGQYILLEAGPPSIDGDFDIDGDVNGLDFLLWQQGGSPDPLSQSDLADWEVNYGAVAPLTATSTLVPEPSTWIAMLIGIMTLHFRRDMVVA